MHELSVTNVKLVLHSDDSHHLEERNFRRTQHFCAQTIEIECSCRSWIVATNIGHRRKKSITNKNKKTSDYKTEILSSWTRIIWCSRHAHGSAVILKKKNKIISGKNSSGKFSKKKIPKNYLRNVVLLQQRSSRGRLTVKLIRDCCWMERANLPPVHATGSRQNTAKQGRCCARSTARSLATPLVVVVVVSCFAAAFTTTKQNPKNNKSSTTILQLLCLYLFIGSLAWAPPPGWLRSTSDDQLIK